MALQNFQILKSIIHARRTVKPMLLNGKKVSDENINAIIELANHAPMHGRTEPWRFFIFKDEALEKFGHIHAEMYKKNTPAESFEQKKYDKHIENVSKASHLIIVAMKKGTNPAIPVKEEMAATAAAVNNILLGATALGIASMWNTGGMTYHDDLKTYLGLSEQDQVIALLYLGYTSEEIKEVPRKISMEEKVKWME